MNILIKTFSLLAIIFLVTGCQTTSNVQNLGNGRYSVSSIACPACGGTSRSHELAFKEASTYCGNLDMIAIPEETDNQTLNAFGAGGTDLVFSCVKEVTEADTSSCYEESFAKLDKHADDILDKAVAIVMPDEEGFPFIVLANETFATEAEASAIKDVGMVWEKCSQEQWSNVSTQYKKLYKMTRDKILASLAKLISKKSTYGEYAAEVNSHFGNMDTQLSDYERQARDKRQAEAGQRMRAASCITQQITPGMSYTSCN